MTTIYIKDALSNNVPVNVPSAGQSTSANSQSVTFASDAVLPQPALNTITQTIVTVGTTSVALVAPNANRKYLGWMVIGTQPVTVSPAPFGAAVVGNGYIYNAGTAATAQGGSEEFPLASMPSNGFNCIAAATGSKVIVWEGV